MKPDIYLDTTVTNLSAHSLVQIGFICATLLLSGGWTDPEAVYVPHGSGYAICAITTAQPPKAKVVEIADETADLGNGSV